MAEYVGLKTKFEREGQTQGTFAPIAQVANIQPPQSEREEVEVEDLDPQDGVKKKLLGVLNIDDATVTLNFDPENTGHAALYADHLSGAARRYRIVTPSGWGLEFEAEVKGWAPQEIGESDVIQVEVTLKVNGLPTEV